MKNIFINFTVEDKFAYDHLVHQAEQARVPFSFFDMSVWQPWNSSWKTRCRERIKQCDGIIALLSAQTRLVDDAKWEMQCAAD